MPLISAGMARMMLFAALVAAALSTFAAVPDADAAPKKPEAYVLPDPLIIFQFNTKWWKGLDDDIRGHSVMEINRFDPKAARAAGRNGIPVIVRLSSWGFPEEYRHIPTPDEIAGLFKKHPNVVGVSITESGVAGLSSDEKAYFLAVLNVCAEYGKTVFWVNSHGSSKLWLNIGYDAAFMKALREHGASWVPIWEMNASKFALEAHSAMTGLWLSGAADRWGVNPQTWYWASAGFTTPGEPSKGWRKGVTTMMPPALYAQMLMLGASTGASVFFIGGEKPPHAFDKGGAPSVFWKEAIGPALKFILNDGVLPARAEVSAKARVAAFASEDPMFGMANAPSGSLGGAHMLRITNPIARTTCRAEDFIPIGGSGQYSMQARIRSDCRAGEIRPAIFWYDMARNKPFASASNGPALDLSRDGWQTLRFSASPPDKATHAVAAIALRAAIGCEVNVDDVSLVASAKGKELVGNGSFENDADRDLMPDGWLCGFTGDPLPPADYARSERNFGRLFQDAYGLATAYELVPDSGRHFIIPIIPRALASDYKGASELFDISRGQPEGGYTKALAALLPDAKNARGGYVVEYPEAAYATNGAENSQATVHARMAAGGYTVEADLGTHGYAFMRRAGAGAELIIDNPGAREYEFELSSSAGFDMKDISNAQYRVKPSDGGKKYTITIMPGEAGPAILRMAPAKGIMDRQ